MCMKTQVTLPSLLSYLRHLQICRSTDLHYRHLPGWTLQGWIYVNLQDWMGKLYPHHSEKPHVSKVTQVSISQATKPNLEMTAISTPRFGGFAPTFDS